MRMFKYLLIGFIFIFFQACISDAQQDDSDLFVLAEEAQENGDNETAVNLYLRVLEINPGFVNARYNLAIIYGSEGRFPEAVRELEIVKKYSPDDLEVLYVLGYTYAQNRQHKEAIKLLEKVVVRDPDNDEARLILGTEYVLTDRNDKAVYHYDILREKGSAKADDLAPWLYLPQEKEKKKQDKELSK